MSDLGQERVEERTREATTGQHAVEQRKDGVSYRECPESKHESQAHDAQSGTQSPQCEEHVQAAGSQAVAVAEAAAGPGGARTGGTGAAGAGGVAGGGAAGPRAAGAGAAGCAAGDGAAGGAAGAGAARAASPRGALAGGTGAARVGGVTGGGATGTGVGGAAGAVTRDPGAGGTGAVSAVSGGVARPRPYYVPLLQQVLGPTPPLLSPPPVQSPSQLQPASPLPGPSPYSGPTRCLTEPREPESRPVSPEYRYVLPVRTARAGRSVLRPRPPPVPGTHSMTLRPSSAPQRVPLPSPPASSLTASTDPDSDSLRAARPAVLRVLATALLLYGVHRLSSHSRSYRLPLHYLVLLLTLDRLEVVRSVVSLSLVLRHLSLVLCHLSLVSASPVCTVRAGRRVSRPRPPPVSGTHSMTLRPSIAPQRVPLPSPPASSLPDGPDSESDSLRAARPAVTRFLATVVNDPLFESTAASALVAELVDFAAACRLDYATSLVAESASASVCPPSVGGECALGTDVLEDRQEEFECFAAAVPHLVSIVLAREGDPDAPDIPTPRSYAEAIEGTYDEEVPPPGANIVSGMWIFRVKRPPGSPPVFKAHYVARGFSQRQGVDFFQTFSPTPKMTTLQMLLHVAAHRDYELHSLDFSTAFLQGSLHEEIWLRRPPGFTGSFPAGTQWSLRRPVYGLRQAPREWHDTLRTTLASLGFDPSTADPSLFLRTDTTLPPFYVLVYVDDLVFATADTEALAHVKSELQKRHTCTDLGELTSYLGLRITRDRAQSTITLTQSHMVQQVLQRFGFTYSSPQSTPLPTGHSLSAPPSDNSSCEAEIYVGAMAAQELRWLTYLLTDLGEAPRSPPVLYVDNKAMLALCQEHRLEHRKKHIALRYFLARELQQRGQLHLAYVASQANTAYVFTKALQPCDHQPCFAFLDWSCDHLFSPTLPMGGRPLQFETWLDDRQLYLLSDSRDSVSLFDHTSGAAPAPPDTADSATHSQRLTRDTTARLAIHNHLPLAECAHFGQHRTAQTLYDAVVARYSSPAIAALGRLLLPYLFPELSAFATVRDLVSHLRTNDTRYRAAIPAELLDRNPPPMYITLYFIVTRLPDSLRSDRDHFLSLDPTSLIVDLLEQHLLAAETSAVAVGAFRGTPHTPFFEGCSPSPLAPSYASAAAVDVLSTEDVGAASASAKRRSSKGKGGRGGGGGRGSGGGGSSGGSGGSGGCGSGGSGGRSGGSSSGGGGSNGSGGSGSGGSGGGRTGAQHGGSGEGQRQRQQRRSETPSPQQLREWLFQRGASGGRVSCPYVIRTGDRAGQTCGKAHTQHRCFSHLDDAWCAEFGDEVERPHWAELLRFGVAIFDLDNDVILSAMYALSANAEGDCYRCVPPDPGIAAAALGASESVLPGSAPAQALHTFTLDSGASRWSSLYTLATEPPDVAASAQVSASGPVSPPCSCRLLWHQTLLSLPPLPPSPAPPCLSCVEGRQRAAPHSSSFPPMIAPLQSLHMDVWGPARVSGQGRERYFLLVVDDYTWYTMVFPLRSKGQVVVVLIPWIRAVRLQLRERFHADFPVLRLHSDRGGEFSSDLLRHFCRGEGILQSFTLPDSPQKNGIAEHRIGLVMEVARTSMIHAAAPHFLWPFAVWYAAHQLNLWPRVSFSETSPTLRRTGKVGNALVFRVWVSRAFVRDTCADKLSARAIPCVFLGFTPDAPGWQFYHPTSRRVFPSEDVTFDESVPFYYPLRGSALVEVAVGSGAAPGAASGGAVSGGAEPGVAESEGAGSGGAEPGGAEPGGAEPGGAEPAGVELGGAETEGVEPGGAESEGAESAGAEPQGAASSGGPAGASPRLSPQQLREWLVRRAHLWSGATGAGGAGGAGAGGAGVSAGAGGTGGTAATGPGGARTRGTGAAGTGGVGGAEAGDPTEPGAAGVGGVGAGGTGASGVGAGGAGAGGTGAGCAGAGGAVAVDHGA
ncbi:unnamed protein product [Closterium sp. NIES-53]